MIWLPACLQAVAALGIALISMGEEMGADMSTRSFEHMLQYGEVDHKFQCLHQ